MMHVTDQAQAALDAYRAALRDALPASALYEFAHAPLDRLGLPLWAVALILPDGALCDGFGYGPTRTAAQASAWGETVEWYWARVALRQMPRRTASYRDLVAQGTPALDPLALCLSAGSGYTDRQPLTWVAARRHPDGEPVWVPIEAAAPRYADIGAGVDPASYVLTPITNGLGAGPTHAHALAHGILELLQRDGNSVSYRALDQGVAVELDDVRDPETRALLRYLDEQGVDVLVKLAATDFGLTNLYVVGADRDLNRTPHPLTLSACGEAVHPDRERALAKALREFVSARARKPFNHGPLAPIRAIAPPGYLDAFTPRSLRNEDDRAFQAMCDWLALSRAEFHAMIADPIYAVRSQVRFSELPTVAPELVADPADLLQLLTERLSAADLPILYVDFAPPSSGISVLKAIVPGLEVETMTYRRIGRRNVERLLQRQSPIVGVGSAPAQALPIPLRPEDQVRLGGPAWLDPEALEQAMGRLYALYREPGRHTIGFLNEQATGGA